MGLRVHRPLAELELVHVVFPAPESLEDGDFRKSNPRFEGENFQHNLRVADEVRQIAAAAGVTPAQVALAWLLAQGEGIAPIPGTKHVARLEENVAADSVELTAAQLAKLSQITPPTGDHHNEAQMRQLDR